MQPFLFMFALLLIGLLLYPTFLLRKLALRVDRRDHS
jgi:hypothetical protein